MSKNWLILLAKVNMLTITAISVDRLLALTLELSYRQVVIARLTRILLITSLVLSVPFVLMVLFFFRVIIYAIGVF